MLLYFTSEDKIQATEPADEKNPAKIYQFCQKRVMKS